MSPIPRRVQLATQVDISYVELGDPRSTVALVLVPGLADSWRSWESVLPHLPPSIRVIAISPRGHGDSTKPHSGYAIRDYAADLNALVDALDLPLVVVAGHSSGALVARRFALDHRPRVAGLVLEGSFVRIAPSPAIERVAERFAALTDPIDPAFVRDFVAGTYVRPLDREVVDATIAENLKVPARVWRETFRSVVEYDDGAELASLEIPTLVVWGDRDTIADRTATDELLRALPSSRLVAYDAVGHSPHWEVPVQFAHDVADFVAEFEEGR